MISMDPSKPDQETPSLSVNLSTVSDADTVREHKLNSNVPIRQPLVQLGNANPMLLSDYLSTNSVYTEENIALFQAKAEKISNRKTITKSQKG